MTLDWQNLIALALVVAAAAYLGWRGWLVLARRKGGCGACASCPAEQPQTIAGKPLVTLEAIKRDRT
jgi:FeoB-associated Cys-rich membrane protein